MTIILGIDPGSQITGFGVIESDGKNHRYIAGGCIRVKKIIAAQKQQFHNHLQQIFDGIAEIAATYKPDEMAIEQVFMHENANSAIKLGQARGSAIVATTSTLKNIIVAEYSARQIKQAVVGYGAAAKPQVQHMIKCLLKITEEIPADMADALAVAWCHANSRQGLQSYGGYKNYDR
jgi:crossover junction endodeoxyribonuclease RuvC